VVGVAEEGSSPRYRDEPLRHGNLDRYLLGGHLEPRDGRRGRPSDLTGAGDGRNGEPRWAALSESIAGKVILPNSVGPDRLPRPFNLRFRDVVPRAVVRCSSPEDVAQTSAFVRRQGLELATRAGPW